jgi:hypothetical protein
LARKYAELLVVLPSTIELTTELPWNSPDDAVTVIVDVRFPLPSAFVYEVDPPAASHTRLDPSMTFCTAELPSLRVAMLELPSFIRR